MGCHFLLQGIFRTQSSNLGILRCRQILYYQPFLLVKVKSLSHVRVFVTPLTVAYQAPLSMGFSRREYWSGLPCPSSGDLPYPGIEPRSPALWQTLYRLSHQGSPFCWQGCKIWMPAICMQTSFPPCMLGVVPLIEGLAGGEVT